MEPLHKFTDTLRFARTILFLSPAKVCPKASSVFVVIQITYVRNLAGMFGDGDVDLIQLFALLIID